MLSWQVPYLSWRHFPAELSEFEISRFFTFEAEVYRAECLSTVDKSMTAGGLGADVDGRLARGILQAMPVLMDAFDDDGRIVVWNAECERVTGYSAAEMIGNPMAIEKLYPNVAYRTFILTQARQRDEDISVRELTAKDGTRKTVQWFNRGATQGYRLVRLEHRNRHYRASEARDSAAGRHYPGAASNRE